MCRRIVAGLLVCVLAGADWPARAAAAPASREIGVVTQAVNARVGTTVLTSGASLFEGDSVATEPGGGINLRSGKALVFVPGASGVTVHRKNDLAQVQLDAGTVVFSVARADAIEIGALGAQIRPVSDTATSAQISIAGPKMLDIHVRRGDLLFTFNNESETISEGSAVRVVLEPQKEGTSGTSGTSDAAQGQGQTKKKSSGRKPLGFFILLIGGASAAAVILLHKAIESPEKP